MSLVHNERTKYLATLVNTVAAGTIIVSVVWLLVGATLHYAVRRILGKLQP